MKAKNGCGGCNVCCSHLEVQTLCKAAGAKCRHISGTECGIYAHRPDECRRFRCLWLAAMTRHEHLRPDRSGLLMYPDRHPEVGRIILCHELQEGAFDRQIEFMYGLSDATGLPVLVRLPDGTHRAVYTSKEQLEQLLPVTDWTQT